MIDTINGARTSAMIYSIAESAKANNLKPYDYFEYLLEEIPKHMIDSPLCWQITLSAEECERSMLAMDAVKRLYRLSLIHIS